MIWSITVAVRVKILSESLANKIAAGEVVERPASVVKELVENSLDAGATDIRIEIAAGGRRLIKVTDNGHGMSREDALLAIERHATSKILADSDLDAICTLGFRGEALPAIASVSRLRLKSREIDTIEGNEIYIEGGQIRNVSSCGMAPGTEISVEQLFYNTPARLKFLRSMETEAAHTGDIVVRLAISRPDVSFLYINDGREQLRVSSEDILQRLNRLISHEAPLFKAEGATDAAMISGFLAPPEHSRSSSSSIFTFVNGRFVRDKTVQHAVTQAYRPLLEKGRYPLLAIFIEISPEDLDVNVHPAKHEVRFRRQKLVHDAIHGVLSEALERAPWINRHDRLASTTSPITPIPRRAHETPDIPAYHMAPDHNLSAPVATEPKVYEPASAYESETGGYFSSLRPIGQFQAAYIICQGENELVIIDQHAAYERISFERLKADFANGSIPSQHLLIPRNIDLSFVEADTAIKHIQELTALGFELEEFGGQTFRLNAIPAGFEGDQHTSLLHDILAELAAVGSESAFRQATEKLLSRIACHSVVRGPYHLERRQMQELLNEMDRTTFSDHCPHGRPVHHTIPLKTVEKMFNRT